MDETTRLSTNTEHAQPPVTPGDGCCPLCGIQVYKLRNRSEGKLRKWKRLRGIVKPRQGQQREPKAIPISIKGKVLNGQCLLCEDSTSGESDEMVYLGEYNIYGERHGHGELIWSNGHRYVGNFFNGMRDGRGTLFLSNGSDYVGNWELDQMNGNGTRRFANGDVFEGSFSNGQRSGQGKLFKANGDLYSGEWKDDAYHGLGRYYKVCDSTALEGKFVAGKKHGKFKLQHASGMLDIIRYENDLLIGDGVRWSKDRTKTWLLTSAKNGNKRKTKKSGRKAPPNASPTFRIKKRIPVVEAVSIGYNCDQESPSSSSPPPLQDILPRIQVPTAAPVRDRRVGSPSWLHAIGGSQRNILTASLI